MTKPYQSFRLSNFSDSLLKFFEKLETPLATSIARHLPLGVDGARFIVSLECSPSSYADLDSFRADYVAVSLLKKCKFLKTGIDVKQVARDNLYACEQLNRATNQRLRHFDSNPLYKEGLTASILEGARWKISKVLGDFDIDEMLDECRWGPGSSTTISYDVATPEEKFRAARGTTPHALELFGSVFEQAFPLWAQAVKLWEFHVGNEVTFVEKNAKTMRSIAKEPDFNLWFQLAMGKMIRRRLLKVGIDLDTQANNQSAARVGSITGQIATLDIKDASNSLSFEVVKHLVSDSVWFACLDSLRSHYGTDGEKCFRWEMFSSMGNGFTFELETLIFWAISAASCDAVGVDPCVWVYGDDIACPPEAVPAIKSVFEFCGFRLNAEKSFAEGPFRESCGVHYWQGVDCQPIYIKDAVTTAFQAYRLANRLRSLSDRLRSPKIVDAASRFHRGLVLGVPPRLRFGVPKSAGDSGFWVNPQDGMVLNGLICPLVDLTPYHEFGWEGFYVSGLREETRHEEANHVGVLLARLHMMGSTGCVLTDALSDESGKGKGNLLYLREPGMPRKASLLTRKWESPALLPGF